MSREKESPSSPLVKSGQFLILPAAILLALACTCGGIRDALDTAATEIASPTVGMPGGGMATEKITPLQTVFPTPTPTWPEPTVTPTIPPTSTPTRLPSPEGGGEWGITQSDLALTGAELLHPSTSSIRLEIMNHGPSTFRDDLTIVCIGEGVLRSNPSGEGVEVDYHETSFAAIASTGTPVYKALPLGLNTALYDYGIACSIDAGAHDPNVSNNGIWFAVP